MEDGPRDRFRANATEITSLVITGLWLGLLLSGYGGNLWLVVLIVGYAAVIPIVSTLFGDEEWEDRVEDDDETVHETEQTRNDDVDSHPERTSTSAAGETSAGDALEVLRTRYAAGELTDAQFERKLERLLEVETLEDVETWNRDRGSGERSTEGGGFDRDLEYDRE